MTKTDIDLIIEPRWIIPVVPRGQVLEDHAIAINQGTIVAIESRKALGAYRAKQHLKLHAHALLPGLINAHAHSPMTLLRGLADDLPLMTWLTKHIWPAEQALLSEAFMVDGTHLAIAEMIRSGTTCFNEHYLFPEVTAKAVIPTGMRACIGMHAFEVETPWAKSIQECLEKGLDAYHAYKDTPLLSFAMAPHAPYTVDNDAFLNIHDTAKSLDIPIHLHLHETPDEIAMSLKQYGQRPLKRLYDLGLLSQRLQAVHMTQIDEDDLCLLQETGTHVTTCPESNLKLASGFCPVQRLLESGINVALGTDGPASNNDLDMFGEMRTLSLLSKAVAGKATALSATQALEIATINGAKAMGLDQQIGSIEVGKSADLIAVDFDAVNTQPNYHPIAHLSYALNSRQVSHVWVAGALLLDQGQYTTLDAVDLMEKAKAWQARIRDQIQ